MEGYRSREGTGRTQAGCGSEKVMLGVSPKWALKQRPQLKLGLPGAMPTVKQCAGPKRKGKTRPLGTKGQEEVGLCILSTFMTTVIDTSLSKYSHN